MLKVMGGGLRAFQRDFFDTTQVSQYRIAHEMLEFVTPYLRHRVIVCNELADAKRLLTDAKSALVKDFEAVAKEQLEKLSLGGCVLLLRSATTHEHCPASFVPVSALRTKFAVNLFVSNEELPEVRMLCGLAEEDA